MQDELTNKCADSETLKEIFSTSQGIKSYSIKQTKQESCRIQIIQ